MLASVDAAPDTAAGLDAGPPCVEDGTYDVPYQLESATPAGCEDTLPIVFPLEANFMVDPRFSSLTLTPVGTCQWAFEYVEGSPFPGISYRSSGVISVGADGIFGRVESSSSTDPVGGCDTVIVLGTGAR